MLGRVRRKPTRSMSGPARRRVDFVWSRPSFPLGSGCRSWSTGRRGCPCPWRCAGSRRPSYACAESTLRRDINGLRYLYAWGYRRFPEGIEARLAAAPLSHGELIDLRGFLLDPKALVVGEIGPIDRVVTATGAACARALSVKLLLVWAVSPAARNERGADPDKASTVVKQIEGVLGPLAGRAGKGRQRVLIENDRLDEIEALLRPEMDDTGRFVQPLRWRADNPFRPALRVRNWLMWCIARDSGLRIGEILTLSATATHAVAGQLHIVVRRLAHRRDDPRVRARPTRRPRRGWCP